MKLKIFKHSINSHFSVGIPTCWYINLYSMYYWKCVVKVLQSGFELLNNKSKSPQKNM